MGRVAKEPKDKTLSEIDTWLSWKLHELGAGHAANLKAQQKRLAAIIVKATEGSSRCTSAFAALAGNRVEG